MRSATPVYSAFGADRELRAMVDEFVDHLPTRTEALRRASGAADLATICQEAQRLRGAGDRYGFEELAERAASLEAACSEGSPEEQVAQSVRELLDLCARLRTGKSDRRRADDK